MQNIRDGDIYKTINIDTLTFEIRYGYYEEYERGRSEPLPIYPDFISEPAYTGEGRPLVTAMQDVCQSFEGGDRDLGCYGCRHFHECEDLIGICNHPEKQKR